MAEPIWALVSSVAAVRKGRSSLRRLGGAATGERADPAPPSKAGVVPGPAAALSVWRHASQPPR